MQEDGSFEEGFACGYLFGCVRLVANASSTVARDSTNDRIETDECRNNPARMDRGEIGNIVKCSPKGDIIGQSIDWPTKVQRKKYLEQMTDEQQLTGPNIIVSSLL